MAISVGVTVRSSFTSFAVDAYRTADDYDVRDTWIFEGVQAQSFRFYIWTNRFPVSYLEDLEDLIQDPRKMLDEVNGRRSRSDATSTKKALDCREAERCQLLHRAFCNAMDNVVKHSSKGLVDILGRRRCGPRRSSLPAPVWLQRGRRTPRERQADSDRRSGRRHRALRET